MPRRRSLPETAAKPRKKANRFRVRIMVERERGEYEETLSILMTKKVAEGERVYWAMNGHPEASVLEEVTAEEKGRPEGRMSAHARKAAGG